MKIVLKIVPEKIKIETEFIRLDSFLKLCNAVQSGGEAKIIIQNGEVKLENEVCTQRGKKIFPGDKITYKNKVFEVEKA